VFILCTLPALFALLSSDSEALLSPFPWLRWRFLRSILCVSNSPAYAPGSVFYCCTSSLLIDVPAACMRPHCDNFLPSFYPVFAPLSSLPNNWNHVTLQPWVLWRRAMFGQWPVGTGLSSSVHSLFSQIADFAIAVFSSGTLLSELAEFYFNVWTHSCVFWLIPLHISLFSINTFCIVRLLTCMLVGEHSQRAG
jgi:hypothetical protein